MFLFAESISGTLKQFDIFVQDMSQGTYKTHTCYSIKSGLAGGKTHKLTCKKPEPIGNAVMLVKFPELTDRLIVCEIAVLADSK